MKLRNERNWSQPDLAARCQRMGWNIGRDTIAKIEDQRRWVGDFELIGLATVLNVPVQCLVTNKKRALELLLKAKGKEDS